MRRHHDMTRHSGGQVRPGPARHPADLAKVVQARPVVFPEQGLGHAMPAAGPSDQRMRGPAQPGLSAVHRQPVTVMARGRAVRIWRARCRIWLVMLAGRCKRVGQQPADAWVAVDPFAFAASGVVGIGAVLSMGHGKSPLREEVRLCRYVPDWAIFPWLDLAVAAYQLWLWYAFRGSHAK